MAKKKIARDLKDLTAKQFIEKLKTFQSEEELKKYQRYFKFDKDKQSKDDMFIGIRMGNVFKTADEFIEMHPDEIEKLLESPVHEVRAGGCSIMGKQGASRNTTDERRKELYDLYLRRHDRINNWDLVDLAAHKVVGKYLFDFEKPRKTLYKLAKSKDTWERRSAILSTLYFIGKNDTDDSFKIAETLLDDKEVLIHKATGWALRYAGQKDRKKLISFLDKHAATMPRVALRYSIEHFDKKLRDHYLKLKVES